MESLLILIHREAQEFWELAEVVGRWVWIQFNDRRPRPITAALPEFVLHWNRRRQILQHPCGTIAASSNPDPRRRQELAQSPALAGITSTLAGASGFMLNHRSASLFLTSSR
jgi:hypothetical protein